MPAEFESGMFVKEPAWHNEGIVLESAPSIEEAIVAAGLDWEVLERPVMVSTAEGKLEPATDYKALVRNTDEAILSVVGRKYVPIQNKEAFNWFNFLLHEGDVALETAGSLRGGKRIWVLAKLGHEADIVKGDSVQNYLLLSNAHDGLQGIWINFTPIRVVCMNTLTAALSDRYEKAAAGKALHFKHTVNVKRSMENAKKIIDLAEQNFKASTEIYKLMAKTKMNDKAFEGYVGNVLGTENPLKARSFETLKELFDSGLGSGIKGVRGTVWGGYNVFTDWIANTRGKDELRLDSAWFGSGSELRLKAYKEAVSMVKAA